MRIQPCAPAMAAALLVFALAGTAHAQWNWPTGTPESQGMSTARLDAMRDNLRNRGTTHFLVIRNDRIVYEWYASGESRTTKHGTASLAKALVGGVSLGVAINDGRISLDDLASTYVPQWAGVALKSQIKVRHLGSHTSGIEDAEADDLPHDQLTGWKGDFWKRLAVPNDPFTISRDRAPMLFAPGGREEYSNPGIAMLTYAVTGSLRNAPVKDIRTLLRDRVMRPIGAPDGEWSVGYGQTFTVDSLPLVASWGGGSYSPNATARVARLMLRKGDWEGQRLISASAVQAITSDAGTAGNGGQGWWTNSDGSGGTAPAQSFWGAGAGHQIAFVVPSLSLIAVRNGNTLESGDFNTAVKKHLFDPLMGAVTDTAANAAPSVSAGANQTITHPSSASLNGTVTDDGKPNNVLTSTWSKVSGPGAVTLGNANAVDTTASFSVAGTYVLRLTATDGALSSSDDVTIQVNAPGGGGTTRIWIAAKTGSLSGLMAKSGDYASGSLAGQLVYPNLNVYNTGNTTQADAVTFTVNLPTSGSWYLWARMYYPGTTAQPTNDPNSFWAAVDGAAAQTLGNLTTKDKTWHWDGATGTRLSLGTVAAGERTLRIWNREARETAAKLSPRLDVVLVTNDGAYVPKDSDVVLGGGTVNPPYPPSAAITGLAWASASSIVRQAPGCDTWPVTWADDDHLYGAYGDGNGFAPQISTKLSLGFARITGSATGFTGTNIRSATGEATGDGAAGKKASGMLMVNGVLYLWVRNASAGAQSQLAWSSDHAATWTWSGWKFAEFGTPTFINFGKNYAGAQDSYVYVYSHDNPSAYNEADRFILMRVPKDRIRDRAAYEFFKNRDGSGNPVWTPDIAQRGAVFSHPGRCRRSGISYNAALKRYLWWQMLHVDGVDHRFTGGFGIYDAPQPWGPWTTVTFTTSWDVGPGETGSFPPKWMSSDGKTIHLLFSGNDAFSVRKATLTAVAPPSTPTTPPPPDDGGGSGGTPPPPEPSPAPPPSGGGGSGGVTIDSVSSGRVYATGVAQSGALYYTDRSYTITSLSASLNGAVLIRTANDDKAVTAGAHLRFTLAGPATLYVAYDKRATTVPSWLASGWTITPDDVFVTDSAASPLRIYTKSVPAGEVTLGGNLTSPAAGAQSNYAVLIKPQ